MAKNVKTKKTFYIKSIYVGEHDFGIDKEINNLAKKDDAIPEEIANKKSSLVSYVTILLWKIYIQSIKQGASILQLAGEYTNESSETTNNTEDTSTNQESNNS